MDAARTLVTLGSFCTESGCADQPWVTPAKGPTVDTHAPMQFELADGSPIQQWSVYYADAKVLVDPEAKLLVTSNAGGYKHISFTGPPAGDLGSTVNVVSDSFDAGYFYRLHVGAPETDVAGTSTVSNANSTGALLHLVLTLAAVIGAIAGWRLMPGPR